MKILVNAVSAKSGGAATYIQNLGRELANTETRFRFVFYVPSEKTRGVFGDNIAVVETDIGHRTAWRRFFWDQILLRRALTKERVDILLSSSDFGLFVSPCPQILMIRNPLFFSRPYLERILPHKSFRFKREFLYRRWLICLSARAANVVITASQSMLDDVRRFISIPPGKAVVNYFGVPLEKFNGKCGTAEKQEGTEIRLLQGGGLRLLYVSEYSDYKNLTTLLKAVPLLKDRGFNDFCLTTTAGPDQFPDVEISTREVDKALASDPRVSTHVKFIGSVPYETIEELYQESDVFIFPSLAESFGHPLVEAMASGLPVIASDIPIHREICGEAAVYFDALDPQDLVNKILTLSSDAKLRENLGKAGRTRAETQFNWNDHVRRLVEIFEQVAQRARG